MPRHAEFPPIGDYALIGDCHTAALISRTAAIEWCPMPRFDSGSTFATILDRERGGACTIVPVEGEGWTASRRYLDDSLVLETTLTGAGGEFTITDAFLTTGDRTPVDPERRLLRVIEGRRGAVELDVTVAPRFDYGEVRPWIKRLDIATHSVIGGNDALLVWCERELAEATPHELTGRFAIRDGDRVRLLLHYRRPEAIEGESTVDPEPEVLDAELAETATRWAQWGAQVKLDARDEAGVRRSSLVLKALTYAPTGAIVAAPTTSLPETVGGVRNWDYRFSWIRDSSFSSRAFAAVGCDAEADAFRHFILRSSAGHADDLQVLFGVGGERRVGGSTLDDLSGYRDSRPARIGNAAVDQLQLDGYGEIVNLVWRWHRRGHSPDDSEWKFVVSVIDRAAEKWSDPDQGLWEFPGEPDHFVHSKVLCWAALERGLRLAEECLRRAPERRWRHVRDEIREAVETRGFDAKRGIFTGAFDRPDLDSALLLLPTVEFIAWDDPRMLATVAAVREELDAGEGLLYRYRRDDGLPGQEGAFLCCSFWLVECLARSGQLVEARHVFDAVTARANDLGLFSEELDPGSGELLGNFPQGLTHLSHIDAAVALAEVERRL